VRDNQGDDSLIHSSILRDSLATFGVL